MCVLVKECKRSVCVQGMSWACMCVHLLRLPYLVLYMSACTLEVSLIAHTHTHTHARTHARTHHVGTCIHTPYLTLVFHKRQFKSRLWARLSQRHDLGLYMCAWVPPNIGCNIPQPLPTTVAPSTNLLSFHFSPAGLQPSICLYIPIGAIIGIAVAGVFVCIILPVLACIGCCVCACLGVACFSRKSPNYNQLWLHNTLSFRT